MQGWFFRLFRTPNVPSLRIYKLSISEEEKDRMLLSYDCLTVNHGFERAGMWLSSMIGSMRGHTLKKDDFLPPYECTCGYITGSWDQMDRHLMSSEESTNATQSHTTECNRKKACNE